MKGNRIETVALEFKGDFQMNTSEYLAKPDKTIKEHTQELIDSLEIIKELGYIRNEETYKLVKLACEYDDLGKANGEFQ